MGIDALEHIDEVDVGIDAWQATGGEQTVDDPYMPRPHCGPAEHPVLRPRATGRISRSRGFVSMGTSGSERNTFKAASRLSAYSAAWPKGFVGRRSAGIRVCLSQAKKSSTSGLLYSPRDASLASPPKPRLRISASWR